MTVPVRAEIGQLPAYKPGRNPEDLARELGLTDAVKLASNENPFRPLPSVIEAISTAASTVNRYPDNGAEALVRALANRFSVSAEQIAVGCGSVSLCQQVLQAYTGAGDEVVIAWRSFEAYPLLIAVAGATTVRVPLAGEVHDLDAMAAAITDRTKVVFVCNPNNPTGTALGRAALTDFLDRVPPSVLVVLDEAYREFVTDDDVPDGVELMRGRPNVVVLRTFSKAYGLAGLRVGYLLSDNPAVAEAVRKTYVPFSVSTIGQAAAVASLAAEEELLDRCAEIVAERDRLVARLAELGSPVPPTQANFVWLPLGDRALEFAAACEKRGVIVRPFAGDGVRVTVGDRLDNDAFCEIVESELS